MAIYFEGMGVAFVDLRVGDVVRPPNGLVGDWSHSHGREAVIEHRYYDGSTVYLHYRIDGGELQHDFYPGDEYIR